MTPPRGPLPVRATSQPGRRGHEQRGGPRYLQPLGDHLDAEANAHRPWRRPGRRTAPSPASLHAFVSKVVDTGQQYDREHCDAAHVRHDVPRAFPIVESGPIRLREAPVVEADLQVPPTSITLVAADDAQVGPPRSRLRPRNCRAERRRERPCITWIENRVATHVASN